MDWLHKKGTDMLREHGADIEAAMQLIRSGRFLAAVKTLEETRHSGLIRDKTLIAKSILADALQRTGQNERAQRIASNNLCASSLSPALRARCHFVLGNVCRESGDTARAIDHFQVPANCDTSDLELCCWAQLRLMISVADLKGIQTALARLDGVRRTLARFGDPRPFAVLHLWMVEIECTRGNLTSARRHLSTAQSLLTQIDDVWLQGYLAINSSGVSYYCAEIAEARRFAELAIGYAQASGHRGARRAAYANIGQIEFSAGNLSVAEEYFKRALECCEIGSSHEIAILDSIARVRLHVGDLQDCRMILKKIEMCKPSLRSAEPSDFNTWPLQTEVQLLLSEGRVADARRLSQKLKPSAAEMPQARTTTVSHLLTTEALLADKELESAAFNLFPILSPGVQLPPDLFAEKERIVGAIFAASQSPCFGKDHLDRALHIFDTIGHCLGKQRVLSDLASFPTSLGENGKDTALKHALCRISALLDTRTQPELFSREAIALLTDLKCTESISFERDAPTPPGNGRFECQFETKNAQGSLSIELWRKVRAALRTGAEKLNSPAARHPHEARSDAACDLSGVAAERDTCRSSIKPFRKASRPYLEQWIERAKTSGIPAFALLAHRIERNFDGIVNAVEHDLSNSRVEGVNAKVRLIQRRGWGYRSPQALIAMTHLWCGGIAVNLPTET